MPDDFEGADIEALYRKHLRQKSREVAEADPVMREQAARRDRRAVRDAPAAPIVSGESDGAPCWTLHGAPVRDGNVIELYTNKANGWLRGQIVGSSDLGQRPRLSITLWNAWGQRDVDGLPPRVGSLEAEIPEGAMCRWSAALPQEID